MKLNLKDIYHWICIAEKNQWKTIFYIKYEYFKYLIIPFNLANVPVIFQVYINEALQHLIDIICVIYLNNILIYSAIKKQHIKNVYTVFLQLWEYCLYINLKKCSFFVSEVKFLKFIMGTAEIKMNFFWIESVMI